MDVDQTLMMALYISTRKMQRLIRLFDDLNTNDVFTRE